MAGARQPLLTVKNGYKKWYYHTMRGRKHSLRTMKQRFLYIVKLSMDKGIIDNELYERLVRKLMLAVVKFKIEYKNM